ncbi:MAG: 5,10-methylenetetrahydrofolate reductase [Glaciihabitans sp.]|nr:5,10-methylenetetrahydrofolate reductase [Glaciihabitans sp.]
MPGHTVATYSFELYPPRTPAAELAVYESLGHLVAAAPEFISVTYGASGSTSEASLGVLRHLLTTSVPPMAHLTCVGWTYEDATRVIREFLDAGLTSFLALRGDPPAGSHEGDDFLGDLKSAGELVQLIHSVQSERVPFLQEAVPGFPQAARIRRGGKVTIAVAAFPNGHPRSRSVEQDLDTLLAKEAAGANLAISQLFFHADDYLRFLEQARAAGVTMRILPGIMPILSPARLHRMVQLTDERMPKQLLARLEAAATPDEQYAVGISHASELSRELLDGGVTGLHLYTFNKHQAVLSVLESVGLYSPTSTPTKEHA